MSQLFLTIAAIFGGLSVAAGAFATHSLRPQLSDSWNDPFGNRALEIFEAGVRYQMYHALALLAVALLIYQAELPPPTLTAAGYSFIAGVLIFSSSLYTLSLTDIKWLGAIAPIGGATLIAGWVCLAIAALNYR